jgi:hypothetical protein
MTPCSGIRAPRLRHNEAVPDGLYGLVADRGRNLALGVTGSSEIPLFGREQNRVLLGTLRRRIRPGGRLAIIDVLPSPDPVQQLVISRYELGLLLRTKAGQVYPLSAYREWTGELGFPGPWTLWPCYHLRGDRYCPDKWKAFSVLVADWRSDGRRLVFAGQYT